VFHFHRSVLRPMLVLAVAAGCLAVTTTSSSADNEQNGPIAFGRWNPGIGDFSLWTARSDGSHQRQLTFLPSFFADWKPNGSGLTFDYLDDLGEHVATIAPDGTGFRQLTFGRGIQEVPRYAPDGKHIVFDASAQSTDDPAFATDIWVMEADGSRPRQVTHGGFDVEPAYSPDGRHLVFGRIVGPTSPTDNYQREAVYVVGTDGSGLREVVPPMASLEHPRWSPDGRRITFNIAPEAVGAPNNGTVFSVRPDGQKLKVLRSATASWSFTKAVWSPDGKRILLTCHSISANTDHLCVLAPHSGRFTVVVRGTADQPVNFPSWGHAPQESFDHR
jgi:Tol biopolymer transport system component